MLRRIRERLLTISAIAALCLVLVACGASNGSPDDVDCDIGVVSHGNQFTATVEVTDSSWEELTDAGKNNVAEQCIETVEFSRDDGDDDDFVLTAFEKGTKRLLFSYRSKEDELLFHDN